MTTKEKILITGGAGFIGSNLVEHFLNDKRISEVYVLDNLSTGFYSNIKEFENDSQFKFIEGDIRDFNTCRNVIKNVDIICHQAALGSVPRSIKDPLTTNKINIDGFLNMLKAAQSNNVRRFVYASSSSVYGDAKDLPKVEEKIGKPLSPYAVSKYVNELYADVFSSIHNIETVGLRYFNVFGPKQNPDGAYAAVIPKFIKKVLLNEQPVIYGDGKQTRDFTYIQNIVSLNELAIFTTYNKAVNTIYNGGVTDRTSLNELITLLEDISGKEINPIYESPRPGDVRDSLASIDRANELLDYKPKVKIKEGLRLTYNWFQKQVTNNVI